jgi:hypothetical protein
MPGTSASSFQERGATVLPSASTPTTAPGCAWWTARVRVVVVVVVVVLIERKVAAWRIDRWGAGSDEGERRAGG